MSANDEVADRLEELAALLEARGDDYRPRSYRDAAENVREYPRDVADLAAEGPDAVRDIEGVGESIAEKIVEYVETGEMAALEDAREALPVDMTALTAVEGVGPKTVGKLYDALGVTDLDDLEAAAVAGEIREVPGFGERSEANIREGIAFARTARERSRLDAARAVADGVVAHLDGVAGVERCEVAGSLRRWRETIGDVDVLVASADGPAVVEGFTAFEGASEVLEAGDTKAALRVDGERVDLRVVEPAQFGSALVYFTGSKEHNVHLRTLALDAGCTVNEYGVFEGDDDGEPLASETEADVYGALDLAWIPPELREDAGELAAAASGDLPDLLAEGETRGDLHAHTDASDGGASLAEMVAGAAAYGHDYLAVTDHATGPGMVGGVGLDDDELREQIPRIREADEDASIDVFAGVEANVDAEGGVSVGDDVLAALDVVVAAPHSGLDGDGTERLVTAMEHPEVDVLGHPTGRLLGRRPGLDVDAKRLAAAAADNGVAIEVNANPARLDADGALVRAVVEAGATVAINTDAHVPEEFDNQVYGVHTARRGWAEAADVLNAGAADDVREFCG